VVDKLVTEVACKELALFSKSMIRSGLVSFWFIMVA